MASSAIPSEDLASSLTNLRLSPDDTTLLPTALSPRSKATKKPAQQAIADSWADDVSSDDDDHDNNSNDKNKDKDADDADDVPANPSTTPLYDAPYALAGARERGGSAGAGGGAGGPAKRPEKTTAVAARLIAGGLGVRAPKRTDEEREYDRAVREKERKRREREREERERERRREEEARKSVWED